MEEKQETQYPYYDKFLDFVNLAINSFEESSMKNPVMESNDDGSSESKDA